MRAGRLVHLVLVLQARGRQTAEQLAAVLEVSPRTVYRDVEALSGAGIPVYATSGPGGGIQLLDGYETRLTGLTGPEAAALGLAGVPVVAAQLGFEPALAAATAKLEAALPAAGRAQAVRMRERFLLDLPGWFDRPEDTPLLEPLGAAVWADRCVEIDYGSGSRAVTRRLDPLGMVCKSGRWYLVARPAGGSGARTYRVDRVTAVRPLDATVERPAGFDLADAWASASASFARDLQRITVRARLPQRELDRLGRALVEPNASDARASATAPDADGFVEVRIPAESVDVAHDELLRLASVLEVLEPAELRARLAATGARLAAVHRRRAGISRDAPTGRRRPGAARP